MEVYLDVLFLENLVMNYFILLLTAKFCKSNSSNIRIFAGALLGAAYVVLLIMLPGIEVYYTAGAKILLSFAIVAVAFTPERTGSFFKTLAIFYISTFIFAGCAFAFLYFDQGGGFVKNGITVYYKPKWIQILFTLITTFIIVKVFWDLIQQRFIRDRVLIPVKIIFESSIINMEALIDTGNSLRDPLSNMPVVVVEFKVIKEILPVDIKSIFEQSKENDLNIVTNIVSGSPWSSRFRLIPFTSLGKENGLLIGFKPDYIEIGEEAEKRDISNVIVGIYNRALSRNNKYNAILSPELVA